MEQDGQGAGAEPVEKPPAPLVITREDLNREMPPLSRPVLQVRQAPAERMPCEGEASPLVPAGFWLRLAAKVLDVLFALFPFALVVGTWELLALWGRANSLPMLQNTARLDLPSLLPSLLVAYSVFYAVYSITSHAAHGKSIGKRICGIRVSIPSDVSSRGLYFLARLLVGVLSLSGLGIGHIVAGFRRDRRALHDLVVDSRVVKERPRWDLSRPSGGDQRGSP